MASCGSKGKSLARLSVVVLFCWPISSGVMAAQESRVSGPSVDLSFPSAGKMLADADAIQAWVATDLHHQLGLEPSDQLVVEPQPRQLRASTIHRIQQMVDGLPVVYRESRLIVGPDIGPIHVLGQHSPFPDPPSTKPTLNIDEAVAVSGALHEDLFFTRLVLRPIGSSLRLAYELEGVFDGGSAEIERAYVDAHDGVVLDRLSLSFSGMERQVFDFAAPCRSARVSRRIGPRRSFQLLRVASKRHLARDETSGVSGREPVDRMFRLFGKFHRFLRDTLEMDSYDDEGAKLRGIVNVQFDDPIKWPQCIGTGFNAFWNSHLKLVGISTRLLRFPEFVGHEFGHAIIDSGSRLIYKQESGALNEAIADAIGISFRNWIENNERLTFSRLADDWRIRSPVGPLRDMQNPRRVHNLPNHYSDYRRIREDDGGVHINSSIINQGFYLLAMGGRHPDRMSGPEVPGIGLDKALEIFGRAAFLVLTPNSSFRNARSAFAHVAEILFGTNSPEWVSTHTAMDAIGIPGYWLRPQILKPDPPPLQDEAPEAPRVPGPAPDPTRGPKDRNQGDTAQIPEPEGDALPVPTHESDPQSDSEHTPESRLQEPSPKIPTPVPPPQPIPDPYPLPKPPVTPTTAEDPTPSSDQPAIPNREATSIAVAIALVFAAVLIRKGYAHRSRYRSSETSSGNSSHSGWHSRAVTPYSRLRPEQTLMAGVSTHTLGVLIPRDGSEPILLDRDLLASSEGLVIGRARELCHVEIREPGVSRRHLRVRLRNGRIWIEDMNTTRRTRLDRRDLSPFNATMMKSGQVVRIGNCRYRFVPRYGYRSRV